MAIDILCESIFIKHLQPFGQINSEESGIVGEGEYTIIIDPLDGSDNFKSKIPYYGSSIALSKYDNVEVGVVSNFADKTIFVKTKSQFVRSELNNISFKDIDINSHASVGFFERAYASKKYAKKLEDSGYKYRSLGAIALSLAYTNQVQFFIYEGKMRPYDVEAGLFMCDGLYQHKEKDLTLICRELNDFKKLKKILL
jgi:myo-inositol-1(or 4)-monophosphatase